MVDKDVTGSPSTICRRAPFWEFTLRKKAVGPNEGMVRPRPDLNGHDRTVGTGVFAVKSDFRLADGTAAVGYCSPSSADIRPQEHLLGYLAPAIVTDSAHVPFWFAVDEEPTGSDVQPYYAILGRDHDRIFPVSFQVTVPVGPNEVSSGLIEDFTFLVYVGGEFRLVHVR